MDSSNPEGRSAASAVGVAFPASAAHLPIPASLVSGDKLNSRTDASPFTGGTSARQPIRALTVSRTTSHCLQHSRCLQHTSTACSTARAGADLGGRAGGWGSVAATGSTGHVQEAAIVSTWSGSDGGQ